MSRGLIVKTNSTAAVFEQEFTNDTIQDAIGAETIEHVSLGQGLSAYVDGEGLLKEPQPNEIASFLFNYLGYPMEDYPSHYINGDVIFLGGFDPEGNDLPLTEEQEKVIRILGNV